MSARNPRRASFGRLRHQLAQAGRSGRKGRGAVEPRDLDASGLGDVDSLGKLEQPEQENVFRAGPRRWPRRFGRTIAVQERSRSCDGAHRQASISSADSGREQQARM